MDRRDFVKTAVVICPAMLSFSRSRPQIIGGVQSGDPSGNRVIIWARADRPARMLVEYATTESFRNARRIVGSVVTSESDFAGKVDLNELGTGQKIFYRAYFEDRDGRNTSEPSIGSFWTPPHGKRDIRFVWSGDTAGGGYWISPENGGMLTYESMRLLEPHFFIHSGDTIYADGPIVSEVRLPDGVVWKNITTEAKSKVAETLEEFRGNYRYNLLDENVRRFNSEIPQIWQWDDHEVVNNWSPGKDLSADLRYRIKDIRVLARNANQAFLENAPMRFVNGQRRVYRKISYGPLLDVFVIDLRSYRAANGHNQHLRENPETAYFGTAQLRWLREALRTSHAVWKIVASDMPIGLVVADGTDSEGRARFENSSNSDGPPRGRELELAQLLGSMKRDAVKNTVWLTADVHYAAAHFYNPARAQFNNFDPFWEFVAGPLNAAALDPKPIDNTFGPEVVFQQHPVGVNPDRSPRSGLQFFGEVNIDGRTADFIVRLRDRQGVVVFTKTLTAT